MTRQVEVVLFREDPYWVARAISVEVSSFGRTYEAALAAVTEALQLSFEDDTTEAAPATGARLALVHV